MSAEPIVLSWSGGKDSALALEALRSSTDHRVVRLLTTVTTGQNRVSIHGVRRSLVEEQARRLDLPLSTVEISPRPANREYEVRMSAALVQLRERGVRTVAFGDLFLEDIRRYREEMLRPLGMTALFPLWDLDTRALARDFVHRGYRALLTCVDTRQLDASFAGRAFDADLLADLPASVDPCGENGEFHTFVHAGPILSTPLAVRPGKRVLRQARFQYCEVE